ncbi:MAG: cobaltochelatase subunit CobN, partial [Deltaproteobacteria bacterium]
WSATTNAVEGWVYQGVAETYVLDEEMRERLAKLNAHAAALPVANHPRDVAINADGTRLAVAGLDGLRVSLFELPGERLVSTVNVRASVNDVLFAGDHLLVLTQGPGDAHPALEGPDFDEDGRPGDSTANVNFQDQQNDIAVIRASDGHVERRYTSDTTCCRDYRDVDPADPILGEFLPSRDLWIVGGSIPEAGALCGSRLYVAYMGSSELEAFDVDLAAGTLLAVSRTGTGFAPSAVACAGDSAVVVSSLGETLETSLASGPPTASVVVGDVSGGRFPSTDAEMGEVVNLSTAPFTVDGDQSCVICHREFGAPDKAFAMPLQRYTDGTRNTMSHRGLADTRPWFFETAMDQNNFFPVLNEFARQENFCCTDPTLWATANPVPADCETNPPAVCATRAWPHNLPTRNVFYMTQAQAVFGRTRAIGDALDPTTALNFQGLTSTLGLSLLHRSRLLPVPNSQDSASVRRGRALFALPSVGCAVCHTGAGFAASSSDGPGTRVQFLPVVSQRRGVGGHNADLVSDGFRTTFPMVVQDATNIQFGVTTLRDMWTHSALFLHDGRARSLREVLATPGHPALQPGETGFNEVDGIPNTHGATSQLTPAQIEDLVAYMLSL